MLEGKILFELCRFFAFRDIAHDPGEHHLPIDHHLVDGELEREIRPIFALSGDFTTDSDCLFRPGLQVAGKRAVRGPRTGLWNKQANVLAD